MLAQLPREAVGAPSLGALKARLDGALGSRAGGGQPCTWQGWVWVRFKLPSNSVLLAVGIGSVHPLLFSCNIMVSLSILSVVPDH